MNELYDVFAVNIATGARRLMAEGKTEANADAFIAMAIARRGLDEEFYVAELAQQRDTQKESP